MDSQPGRALCTALALLLMGASRPVAAQTAAPVQNVELEPIACYWRTSTDAVRLGEFFTLVLTCGVLDTAATTVVPDQSRLDPAVLQLQPFEVKGGTQAPDLKTPTRRFFQYQYQLRYVGEEVGKDLVLPPLTLTYRVQSRVQQDSAAVESRERQYILPAHTIRVLSIVPMSARDIRDASPVTLAEIDSRRFRASMLRIASWALYAVSAVVALWGLLGAARRRRGRSAVVVRHATRRGNPRRRAEGTCRRQACSRRGGLDRGAGGACAGAPCASVPRTRPGRTSCRHQRARRRPRSPVSDASAPRGREAAKFWCPARRPARYSPACASRTPR